MKDLSHVMRTEQLRVRVVVLCPTLSLTPKVQSIKVRGVRSVRRRVDGAVEEAGGRRTGGGGGGGGL